MRWLGICSVILVLALGAGCTLSTIPEIHNKNQPVLGPSKKILSPSEIGPVPFTDFEDSTCILNQIPQGSSCVGIFASFDTNAKIVNPTSFGSTAVSGAKGVANIVTNNSNNGVPLTINMNAPMLKMGLFLLPRTGATGKATLTGFDVNGRKVTSTSVPIPTTTATFIGIGATRGMRSFQLNYNSELEELIDDLYLLRECADVRPVEELDLALTTGSSSVRATARIINVGNGTAQNTSIFFKILACPGGTCPSPATPAGVSIEKTISKIGPNRQKSLSVVFSSLTSGRYLVAYGYPTQFSPKCSIGSGAFISDEVVIQ